jgi:hypothetical protein
LRVTPSAAVNGAAGTGCSRARSSASISAGARRVMRCGRALTWSQNSRQAASSAAKLAYSSRRFASVGTRSAFAIFTVDSEPPLEAGSYGTQVATVSP